MNKITEKQAEVMIWVKLLNDFENPEDTLDDKIENFNLISAEITSDEFKSGMNWMCERGVIILTEENKYELTSKGNVLFKALSAMKNMDEKVIAGLWNGTVSMVEFIKNNKAEIVSIILALAIT